ncbi:MAG: purine-binding chemotaxis protein CheW [Desulfobacterales bacterium]|nr:purine-binding chemotaxis protein CheW [Desulfobacterales bacterium]
MDDKRTRQEDGMVSPPLDVLVAQIEKETEEGFKPGKPAAPPTTRAGAYGRNQYIRFFLGDVIFGVSLSRALEISHLPDITSLPNLPEWILGVANIRGEVISVIDLKRLFAWPRTERRAGSHLIILRGGDLRLGVVVDQVRGIFSLDGVDSEIMESPLEKGRMGDFIRGVIWSDKKLLHVLDVDKLLSSTRVDGPANV